MRRWQEQLLSGRTALPAKVRSQALWLAGDLAGLAGDYDSAVGLLEVSLATAQEIGDEAGVAKALYLLGNVAEDLGDIEREIQLYDAALSRFQKVGDPWWIPEAMAGLGRASRKRGDYAQARQLHEEALGRQRAARNRWGVAWGTTALAELEADEGHVGRAAALFAESLQLHASHSEQMGTMYCLLGLGKLACLHGPLEAGAIALGAAEALRESRGLSLPQDHRLPHDTCLARLRADLGETRFTDLWSEGRSLSLEQAADRALDLASELSSSA
jgi:non-specific serine/threonine protein kinase